MAIVGPDQNPELGASSRTLTWAYRPSPVAFPVSLAGSRVRSGSQDSSPYPYLMLVLQAEV